MFKHTESREPESPFKAAQRRATEERRRNPQSPISRRRRPWEKPPDVLFWSFDELVLFPLADDDVIIIAETGETRRFDEPSYDDKGRRLYPSSIKSAWQQIVLFYFIVGLIVGAALCYLFLKDALCW